MDIREEWISALRSWASKHDSIRELWLFGSRAEGRSKPDSDVDVAIALVPTGWALGIYEARGDEWQRELGMIVGRHVSLEAILPDTKEDAYVRSTGKLLWARS